MLRSIAIIMMLEGHFISLTWEANDRLVALYNTNSGSSGNTLFDVWHYIRGITSPLFFFISGTIFTYLLYKSENSGTNKRVRYGFRRGALLILLGYLLQFNIRYFQSCFNLDPANWLFAFHVLQSIGVSMIIATAVFLISRRLGQRYMWVVYILIGLLLFMGKIFLERTPGYFPSEAPSILQNLFKGPYSVFPLVPWAGYYFFGACLGFLAYRCRDKLFTIPKMVTVLLIGLVCFNALSVFGLFGADSTVQKLGIHLHRLGVVVIMSAIAIWLESKGWLKNYSWLILGRNTLWVYFVHVIILYGGITGFGLKNIWSDALSGWEVLVGAVVFILFFYVLLIVFRKQPFVK